MPKSKVFRNEVEHKVRLREGSDVASSHEAETRGPSAPAVEVGTPTSSALVKARSRRNVNLPYADDATAQPRGKLRPAMPVMQMVGSEVETRANDAAVRPTTPQPDYKPPHTTARQPNLPEAPAPLPKAEVLWKPGSFVLQRMSSLRSRNAKVQDQIQLLRRPYSSGGK